MKIRETKEQWTARFESLPELNRWLAETPRQWPQRESVTKPAERNWDLEAGWEGAMQLAQTGWAEGAAMIERAAMTLHGRPVTEREAHWGFDVAGDLPDVGRFMAGRPDNMRRRRQTVGRAPILTIALGIGTAGSTRASAFANYGVALAGLIDRLESAGRRVELFAVSKVTCEKGKLLAVSVRLKGPDEPLDMAALAFGVAHPAMLRRLVFAVRERAPMTFHAYGYGGTAAVDPSDVLDSHDGTLAVTGLRESPEQASTPEGAIRLAMTQINRAAVQQGIVPEGEKLVERVTE